MKHTICLSISLLALLFLNNVACNDDQGEVIEDSYDEPKDPLLVTVTEGIIKGKKDVAIDGREFYSFTGIPYASPPVGKLRFMPPSEPKQFDDILDATQGIPICPQVPTCTIMAGNASTEIQGTEDCLHLNVFTPNPHAKKLLPVMVFIHGGGYFFGHAGQYPPHTIMTKDIVYVAINYRLGALGFLSTEDEALPGNMGLLDQQKALDWIHHNIQYFGGSNIEVTLFGESAGASSIHLHMMSPSIRGKFKRVILQSGTALSSWAMGENHLQVALFIAMQNKCQESITTPSEHCDKSHFDNDVAYDLCLLNSLPRESLLDCLQTMDVASLAIAPLSFFKFAMFPLLLGPRVHNNTIIKHPTTMLKERRSKNLDMMIGVTKDEGAVISTSVYANEHSRSKIKMNFENVGVIALDLGPGDVDPVKLAATIADHYVGDVAFSGASADNVTAMYGDKLFWYPSDTTARLHSMNPGMKKKNIYNYEFAYRGEQSLTDYFNITLGKNWVTHADDIIYLFGKFDSKCEPTAPVTEDADVQIRNMMIDLWTNFAIYGNPTPPSSPFLWNPYTKKSPQWLVIDSNPHMVTADSKQQIRDFWQQLPLELNLRLEPDRFKGKLIYVKNDDNEADSVTDTTQKPDNEADSPKNSDSQKIENIDKKDEL